MKLLRDKRCNLRRHTFDHDSKCTRFFHCFRIFQKFFRCCLALSLHFKSTKRIDGLWGQTNVCTHRNSGIYDCFDLRTHFHAAFQFDRIAASFLHQTSSIDKGIINRSLVRHKWHINDNQRIFSPTRYRCAVMDHVFHRNGNRVLVSKDHISQRITNQYAVYACFVDQFCRRIIISSQHCQFFAIFLCLLKC